MTSDGNEGAVTQVERPEVRAGRLHCPRCDARLMYDGEELVCLACGYEYIPNERELAAYRSGRVPRPLQPVLGLASGLIAAVTLGKAGIALGMVLLLVLLAGSLRGQRRGRRRYLRSR